MAVIVIPVFALAAAGIPLAAVLAASVVASAIALVLLRRRSRHAL
jgi:hypothetical protein